MAAAPAAHARACKAECLHGACGFGAAMGPEPGTEMRARIREVLAARSRWIIRAAVRRSAGPLGRCPRRRTAPALHRQLLHTPALPRCGRPLGASRQRSAEESPGESAHPLVRGPGRPLARFPHRLWPLVDAGVLS